MPAKFLFEFHLTIEQTSSTRLLEFQQLCQQYGGKAILIELATGVHTQQPMFSWLHSAPSFNEFQLHINHLCNIFAQANFPIIRQKVEIPAHDVTRFFQTHPQHIHQGYYEWHGKIHYATEQFETLKQFAQRYHAHLSKNQLYAQKNYRFLTIREYQQPILFYQNVEHLISALAYYPNLTCIKSQYEYCIYDTAIQLDKGWL